MEKAIKRAIEVGDKIECVCKQCGISANVLTCLKIYGHRPNQLCFTLSTWHLGICDFCKKEDYITQTRDFFHPDFSLLAKKTKN